MPVKAEAEPIMATVAVAEVPVLASSEILTEEENDALNQISQRFVSSWSICLGSSNIEILDNYSVLRRHIFVTVAHTK